MSSCSSFASRTDPTDLIALVLLPLAFWVAQDPWDQERAHRTHGERWTGRAARSLLMITSAVGCLATSAIDYTHAHAIVANDTGSTLTVEVSVLSGVMSCSSPRLQDGVLDDDDFVWRSTLDMASKDAANLDTATGQFPEAYTTGTLTSEEATALENTQGLLVRPESLSQRLKMSVEPLS